MKIRDPKAIGLIAAVAVLFGVVVGWCLGRAQANRELLGLALAQELEATGLCANGLKLETTQHPERLVMLLEQRLDDAVRNASELVGEGARLSGSAPNLKDSVRRAAEYYSTKGEVTKRSTAEALLVQLETAR